LLLAGGPVDGFSGAGTVSRPALAHTSKKDEQSQFSWLTALSWTLKFAWWGFLESGSWHILDPASGSFFT